MKRRLSTPLLIVVSLALVAFGFVCLLLTHFSFWGVAVQTLTCLAAGNLLFVSALSRTEDAEYQRVARLNAETPANSETVYEDRG